MATDLNKLEPNKSLAVQNLAARSAAAVEKNHEEPPQASDPAITTTDKALAKKDGLLHSVHNDKNPIPNNEGSIPNEDKLTDHDSASVPNDGKNEAKAENKKPYNPKGKSLWQRAWDYLVEEETTALAADSKVKMGLDFMFNKMPGLVTKASLLGNFVGFFLELTPLKDNKKAIDLIENINKWVTRLSFLPFSWDGILTGIKKKDLIHAVAFALEPVFVMLGDLKDIFLLRGISVGIDQLPVASQKITEKIFGSVKFPTWEDGLREVPKALMKLTKELFTNPIKYIFTTKPKGHVTVLSSIGDLFATVGYLATGRKFEKFFGAIRDFSSLIFDWELLLDETKSAKIAGVFFILEDLFDWVARYMGPWRLAVNQLAHASGRFALECYKNHYKEKQELEKTRNSAKA